jgi:hypothetical protein
MAFNELLKIIWTKCTIPTEWKTAIVVPIHKKGDTTKCSNYRGISLLNIGFKILEVILYNRLAPAYSKTARQNQAGFKKNRGCRDQVFALRQIIGQRHQHRRNTVLTFIDFKAAFDSVSRQVIWDVCTKHSLPENILNLLQGMYTETYCCIHTYN